MYLCSSTISGYISRLSGLNPLAQMTFSASTGQRCDPSKTTGKINLSAFKTIYKDVNGIITA